MPDSKAPIFCSIWRHNGHCICGVNNLHIRRFANDKGRRTYNIFQNRHKPPSPKLARHEVPKQGYLGGNFYPPHTQNITILAPLNIILDDYDLTRWDRRKAVLFVFIAVVASGVGGITFDGKTDVRQGLPFSFYRYSEPTSEQVSQGPLIFFAPAFILDILVWYMVAYLAIRFYDNSTPKQ